MESYEKVQCENCGSTLQIAKNMEFAICPHCNTTYIRKSHPTSTLGSSSLEELLSSAEKFLKAKEWNDALNYYQRAEKAFPSDYRVFWGLFCAFTQNMTLFPNIATTPYDYNGLSSAQSSANSFLGSAKEYSKKALILAPDKKRSELSRECEPYLTKLNTHFDNLLGQARQHLDRITQDAAAKEDARKKEYEAEKKKQEMRMEKLQTGLKKITDCNVNLVMFLYTLLLIFFGINTVRSWINISKVGVLFCIILSLITWCLLIYWPQYKEHRISVASKKRKAFTKKMNRKWDKEDRQKKR